MPPVQFELEDDEALMLANEMLGLADGIADKAAAARHTARAAEKPIPDTSYDEARATLLRHFGALLTELAVEARAWPTKTFAST